MPLYAYTCKQEHVTEARRGIDCEAIPCPACGQEAERVAIYESQYIIGETVAKSVRRSHVKGEALR